MILKSLTIRRRESYESEKGFTGELVTTSPNNEVKIKLTDESCRKILIVAGEGVKEAALETQAFLTASASLLAEGKTLEIEA